jgi:hypothetical protein
LKILATDRFYSNLERFGGDIGKRLVINQIRKLIRIQVERPKDWTAKLEQIKNLHLKNVYRIQVTKGDRLLFIVSDSQLTLLDVGPHSIYDQWEKDWLSRPQQENILETRKFVSDEFFEIISQSNDSKELFEMSEVSVLDDSTLSLTFEEELDENWLYFLDDQQMDIKNAILDELEHHDKEDIQQIFLVGAAGTGKTVVLSEICRELEARGFSVKFKVNAPVRKQLIKAGVKHAGLTDTESVVSSVDFMLVDDPLKFEDVSKYTLLAKSKGVKGIVFAADPLQWHKRKSLEKYDQFVRTLKIEPFLLTNSYRQSEEVGKGALQVTRAILRDTNPYAALQKKKAYLDQIRPHTQFFLDEVSFNNPGGIFQVLEGDLQENLELQGLRFRDRWDRWTWTSPLLLVWDPRLSHELVVAKDALKGMNITDKPISSSSDVRGLEFQEVFILISASNWAKLNTRAEGVGQEGWEFKGHFHNFFTRAKDGVTVFVA